MKSISRLLVLAATGLLSASCSEEAVDTPKVELKNHSVTPALVKGLPSGVEVFSIISSEDKLAESPSYVFGGSADGAGLLKNSDGTFTFIVNHEDNYSVSRVTFDNTFKPTKGEYIVNSDKGQWRLCSATMVTPDEHGFGPTFLTCGESHEESMTHQVDPYGAPNTSRTLPALGHFIGENAMPLPKNAYSGKTVIVATDDDFVGVGGGQVFLYVSTVGDLDNGTTYMLTRDDNNEREMAIKSGQSYPVTFKKIDNIKTISGKEINDVVVPALHGIRFGRVEDCDYRKGGNGREVYFNTTGQNYNGVNADSSRTKFGRVYKLVLDASDPTKGTIECILDGDIRPGIADKFQNPDNILATTNYLYIQEDPNGYGDETHDAYIYQYNLNTKTMSVVMELDHKRGDTKYNPTGDSKLGSWEYGAMIDVSSQLGIDNVFMLCIQPHTWNNAAYKNPDGGTKRLDESQASQIILVKGLPR
jgi:hypothetical protein